MKASCETCLYPRQWVCQHQLNCLRNKNYQVSGLQMIKSLTLTLPKTSSTYPKNNIKLFQNYSLQQSLREGGKPPQKKPQLVCSKVASYSKLLRKGRQHVKSPRPSSLEVHRANCWPNLFHRDRPHWKLPETCVPCVRKDSGSKYTESAKIASDNVGFRQYMYINTLYIYIYIIYVYS